MIRGRVGLEGRKQEEAGAWLPQPEQGAENADTDQVCGTGPDTADGCETRAIPWRRDLSPAVLRSPGQCHSTRAKSEAAEHGAVHSRLWRAEIVLLECQQSCGRAAVLPGMPEATRFSPSTARTQHARSSFPPGEPGSCRPSAPAGWSTMARGGEMIFPWRLQGGEGHRRAAKPLGSRQRLCPPTAPKRHGHRAGAFLPATSCCIPLPTDTSAALLPQGIAARVPTLGTVASRVPATPPAPAPRLTSPGPGDSHVGSPAAAQRQLSPRCGNSQLSARQGQRDFTGTSPAGGRPPSPRRPRFLSQ